MLQRDLTMCANYRHHLMSTFRKEAFAHRDVNVVGSKVARFLNTSRLDWYRVC